MALSRIALIAVAGSLLVPATAAAQGRSAGKAACGADYLALVEGAVLVYEHIPATEEPPGPKANWPTELTIEITEVAISGKQATVTLRESFRDTSRETTIKCGPDGIRISPQSFFFAGEAGGGLNLELEDLKQDQPDLPAPANFRSGQVWTVYIKAAVKRAGKSTAKLGNGRVEIDREIRIGGREPVESATGEHRGYRVDVMLGGRAAVEPALDKWVDLPPANAVMWLVDGLGLVRAENRFGHGWQLKSRTIAGEADE
jgi:hypothetical protein